MNPAKNTDHWEAEVAALLEELSQVQDELLALLGRESGLLAASDVEGMSAVQTKEAELLERLSACQRRRGELLRAAAAQGLPAASLRELAESLPQRQRRQLRSRLREAAARVRLLQHQGLTNWVLVQRSLIHLSQMLEIIATGGRMQPTYDKGRCAPQGGALLDRAV